MCPIHECDLEVYADIDESIEGGIPHHQEYEYYGCPKCDYTEEYIKEEVEYEYA